MTILGMTFEQAASSFGWVELVNFSKHLPIDSASQRAIKQDESKFAGDLQRAALLADIFDAINGLSYMFAKAYGGKPKKPKPYPRPWADDGSQRIGSDPIPVSQFNSWYYGGDA